MSLTKIRKSNIESNVQLPHANAAFDTANSSGVYANAAFTAANNAAGGSVDSYARDTANSAYSEANNKLNLSGGTLTGNLVVGGNVIPTTDNTHYLGSETARWHSLYVGDGSIYIGDLVLSNDANRLAVTDSDGNKVTISSNNIVLGDFVLSSSGAITGDVIITGNLKVTGTTAELEVSGLIVDDNIIDINEATLGAPTLNAGLRVKRGDENPVLLRWNETNDRWEYTNDGTNYSNIASAAAETYANAAFNAANTVTIGFATETYVSNAVANLVNSAPETLDTLNELAIALNNDPSFATTITTSIGIIGSYANSAYLQANTPSDVANSAAVYANAAFNAANNAVDTWVRDAANSASLYANSSFLHANASFDYANTLVSGGGGGSLALSVVHDSFVADGTSNTYTLSTTPFDENYTLITFDGVVQHKSTYNVVSSNIEFTTVPDTNTEIDVMIFTGANVSYQAAYDHANAAYEQANTGGGGASAARSMTMAILFG